MENLCWSMLLAETVAHGIPMLEQSVPKGLHSEEKTHAEVVLEELQLPSQVCSAHDSAW